MRQILILSVAMLLVLALADAGALPGSQGSSEDSSHEEQKEENPTKHEGTNSGGSKEASGEKSECGKPKGDNTVLRWEETVDPKTARAIQNVIKKGKGKATGGEANKIENVKIIIEAPVDKNNANALLGDLVKEQRTSDAKANSSGTQDNDGTSNDDDNDSEKDSGSKSDDAKNASTGSGDK